VLAERIANLIERRAVWIVSAALVATVLATVAMRGLRIEHQQRKYAPPADDPVVLAAEHYRSQFAGRTPLVAALRFDRPIGENALERVRGIENVLRTLPGVASVWGLDDLRTVIWDVQGPHFVPVTNADSITDADVMRLRRLVESTPVYHRGVVTPDWRTTGVVVELERENVPDREAREATAAAGVDSVLRTATGGGLRSYSTGLPLLTRKMQQSTRHDLGIFSWLTVLVVGGILLALFRQWRPVVWAGMAAALALLWTLGLLGVTGTPVSASLAMIVPLVLVVSVAFAVHYLSHYYGGEGSVDRQHRYRRMMQLVFMPSILTGLTTVVGFLALATSRLQAVRETGAFLAAGVVLSMAATSVLLPALLSLPIAARAGGVPTAVLPQRVAQGLATLVSKRAAYVIFGTVVLVALAIVGSMRLRFDANPLHFFPRHDALRRSAEVVDSSLGGSLPLEIVVRGAAEEIGQMAPAVLRVERQLREMPQVGFVGSALDFLQMAETMRPPFMPHVIDPAAGRFPPGLWTRIASEPALRPYVVRDSGTVILRVSCRVAVSGSDSLRDLVSRVEGLLASESLQGNASVTGMVPLLLRTQAYMVHGQTSSALLAFAVIFALVFCFVRSWQLGALAVVANVVPLVLIIGVMGWLNLPMDIASMMITSIALGIIVDDTIHLLYRYKRCRSSGLEVREAIAQTYAVVGVPMVVTSMVFVAGFLILVPSSFQPTSMFGLLSAVTIAAAFVADLLLLPALIVVFLRPQRGSAETLP